MASSQSSSESDGDLTSNISEDDNISTKSPNADVLSWEVLDDSDSRPVSDVAFSPPSKQQDTEDWILEPDNDRDSIEAAMCMPIIESITSLNSTDGEVVPVSNSLKEVGVSLAGPKQLKHNDSAMSGEDSDRLVIDTSSAAELDLSEVIDLEKRKAVTIVNSQSSTVYQNGKATTVVSESVSGEENEADRQTCTAATSKAAECQDAAEFIDEGCTLVISAVQGSPVEKNITDNNQNGNDVLGNDTADKSILDTTDHSMEESASVNNVIVVDPEWLGEKTGDFDMTDFQPGIIKVEPLERISSTTMSSPSKSITSTSASTVSVTSSSISITTSASLSGATTLTSASQYVRMSPVNQLMQLVQGQPHILSPRTVIRASPRNPVPQVLVRHAGGPRARPSYIRLGSQTLQQFARMTSPPTPHGLQTSQQRMISVLMDRGHGNAITTMALPANFSPLLQAGPPGTLVNSGNANNQVKVLILPSQANSTGQVSQSGLQLATSSTSVHSATSVTSKGQSTSVSSSKVSKSIKPAPELKSASQFLGPPLSKVMTTTQQVQKPANTKAIPVQSGSTSKASNSGSKSQGTKSKSGKASQEKLVGDSCPDILQTMAASEDRLKRRLLSKTNLVREYHPSLTSGLNMVSFEFYSCHGCRDVFVNKSSLENHKARQSMIITYMCDPCKLGYTFTNKCQFRCHMLKHVQEVKNIHKSLLDRINIKPIQYGPSKSGKSDDLCNGEPVSVPSPVPFETNISKEASPPVTSTPTTKGKKTKEVEKVSVSSQPTISNLGITISSVMSLDNTKQVSQIPSTSNTNKPTTVTVVAPTLPPPLTFANTLTAVIPSPLPGITVNASDSPRIVTLEYAPASVPVAVPVPVPVPIVTQSNSQSNSPTLCPNSPPSQKSVQSLSITMPQPVLPRQGPPGEGGNIFCTECSATFSSYMKLQRHFNDADKPHPLRPPCCNSRLATECGVRAHMRTHLNQRPFVCGDCGECFRGELPIYIKHTSNCKRVMSSAVMVFPCPRCQRWYSKINDLRLHVRDEHSESYLKCNLCPMAFKSVSSFKEHNVNKHVGVHSESISFTSIYKCPLCDSVFHDQQMKLDHLQQHINSIYANQRVSFVCNMCKKLCYNYAMMRYHLKDKHMVSALGNMCDLCGVDCGPTIKHLVAHQRKVHSTFPANMMVDPFTQRPVGNGDTTVVVKKSDIQPPNKAGQANGPSIENGSIQPEVGQDNVQKNDDGKDNAYHRDLTRTSGLYNQTQTQCGEEGDGDVEGSELEVKCHICRQTFNNRKDLVRHKKIDHGLMKRKRVSTSNRTSPTSDQSKKIKPDDEDLLDETTAQFQVKSNYMLRFECDKCDYRTPTFEDLQMHQVEEHGIKARFPCLLCGMTHQSTASLEEHIKATHEGQIREYAFLCWICMERGLRKGYTKRAHLVRHFMSYHKISTKQINNERLDEMEQKAELSGDGKLKEQEADSGQGAKRLKVDGEDSCFSCVKCDFECASRDDFQAHISKHKRGGTDSFQCPECGMCFTVLPALKNHLRLVHKIKNFTQYIERSGVKLKAEPEKNKSVKKSPAVSKASCPASASDVLECTVCYRVYQDEGLLKKHMRSHGMAFIRSKRLAPLAFLND